VPIPFLQADPGNGQPDLLYADWNNADKPCKRELLPNEDNLYKP
jgi:hypothetical protein